MDSSTTTLWTGLFPIAGCLIKFCYYCFIEIPVLDANNVDPDQTPRSDVDLHCLPMTLLGFSRLNGLKK